MTKKFKMNSQHGFTIIELMIATSVLSTILLMASIILISIGNLYYKGVNQSSVQDNTRSIVDDVAQHLKLGVNVVSAVPMAQGSPTSTVSAFCVDNTRYTYALGVRAAQSTTLQHILWRDTILPGATCMPALLTAPDPSTTNNGKPGTGTEISATNTRLTEFSVTTSSPYTVTVGVAFGDPTLSSSAIGNNVVCLGTNVDQFCSTAYLTTIVDNRGLQ